MLAALAAKSTHHATCVFFRMSNIYIFLSNICKYICKRCLL